MSLSSAHDQMESACGTHFGFGVAYEVLRATARRTISEMVAASANENWPTTRDGVAISIYLNPADFLLKENVNSQNFNLSIKYLVLLQLRDNVGDIISEVLVAYGDSLVGIAVDHEIGNKISLNVDDKGNYEWTVQNRPGDFLQKLAAAGFVDANGDPDEQEYLRFEFGIFTFQPDFLLRAALDLTSFPPIREGLKTIKLANPIEIDMTKDYLAVHSENLLFDGPNCPFGISASRQINVLTEEGDIRSSNITIYDGSDPDSAAVEFDKDLDPFIGMEGTARPNSSIVPNNAYPVVYYYQERNIYEYTFGKVSPSVTYNDRNRFGPIHWYYGITAALKGVKIRFRQLSPTQAEIILDSPIRLFGQAGARIRIGCIDYNV